MAARLHKRYDMPIRGTSSSSPRDPLGSIDVFDADRAERGRLVFRLQHWEWLHELRNRFELAIEVLDADLHHVLIPVAHAPTATALRAAVQADDDGLVRCAAATVLRTASPHVVAAGGLRVRLLPLFARLAVRPVPVGVLLVADLEAPAAGCGSQTAADIDRRLDATGQWLAAAVEAAVAASAEDVERARTTERLAAVVDIIDVLSRSDRERDILELAMEALALWYDADVRLYRSDVSDAFVLESCLPGAQPCDVAVRLSGASISARSDVFRLDSMDDAGALGWTGPADTLFVPVSIDDSTEWLLTVSGACDPALAVTLGLLSRVVSVRLTHLHREAVERLRASLRAVLTFGDAPFDATLRLTLEVIARETGALSAQLATYGDAHRPPMLIVGWAYVDDEVPLFAEACTTTATSHGITTSVAAGAGLTAVLALRTQGPGFLNGAVRLAQAAAEMLGVWLSGAMVRPCDVRVLAESEYSTEFVGRLTGHVDTLGRLRTGGVVAVVLPQSPDVSGVQLDEVMQVVQERVRSSDVVGVVGNGAGVFIPEASREAATALVNRLIRGAEQRGVPPVRVGMTTFPPLSESPETLVHRARVNAQREASAS